MMAQPEQEAALLTAVHIYFIHPLLLYNAEMAMNGDNFDKKRAKK
jgi:hypothetical protein